MLGKLVQVEWEYCRGTSFYPQAYQNEFPHSAADTEKIMSRLQQQFYQEGELRDIATINLFYLSKIAEYCRHNQVQLTLVNTPLHSYYRQRVPAWYIQKLDEVVAARHLSMLDYSSAIDGDSSFIPDGDHLSPKGAALFTRKLHEDIGQY